VCRFAIIKEALGPKGNNHLSTKQAKWRSNIPTKTTHRKKNDDVVPMEIDSAKVQGRNPEREAKNARLCKEGQCFKCHKIGHLKKNCPEWPSKSDKPPPYPSKGCATNLFNIKETKEEEEQPGDLKELARSMSSLGDDQRDELFDLLLKGSEDF
jgi:hypothetical protein